jgi:3-hydroxyisobutyrate dehydrogenase
MARVAMVGLGRMGSGMAFRLLGAGHEVVVANRTPERAAPLVAAGAVLASTPAEAAAGAAAVLVMVSDDQASRAVWDGPDGALAALAPGTLAIECSTLSADRVRELALAAGARGLRYVDAPVTGLPEAAAAGRLTLLVGADADDLDAARPFLEPLAEEILHFGPVGAGTAYKLIVNLIGAVQIAGVAEGLAVAERAGLDLGQVVAALALGQAASPQVVRNSRRMAASDHAENVVFSGRLRHKDADYAMRLAAQLGIGAPLGQVALDGLDDLLASGLGEVNESAIIEVARRRAPESGEPAP